jgi:hypothetical protein
MFDSDVQYQEWLENAKKGWDIDEMLDVISRKSGVPRKQIIKVLSVLHSSFECGEMLEHLIENFNPGTDDIMGQYMGRNL